MRKSGIRRDGKGRRKKRERGREGKEEEKRKDKMSRDGTGRLA